MSRAESGPVGLYHRVVVYVLFAILLLPLAGTLLYSVATSWSASLLPSGKGIWLRRAGSSWQWDTQPSRVNTQGWPPR